MLRYFKVVQSKQLCAAGISGISFILGGRNMKKSVFVLSVIFLTGVLSFAADVETDVKIDFRMNTAKEDYASNYFSWTLGNQETVKDSFDAVSGASLKGSTKAFNAVRYAGDAADKKAAIPAGLRSLFLFPLADWKIAGDCGLQVSSKSGVITIRFTRKTTAYELKTDKKGNFNILTGAKIAKDIAEKTETGFVIKHEYLKAGGDPTKPSDLDWNKVPLENDTFASDAAYHYEGTLKFTFKKNILTANGTLNRK